MGLSLIGSEAGQGIRRYGGLTRLPRKAHFAHAQHPGGTGSEDILFLICCRFQRCAMKALPKSKDGLSLTFGSSFCFSKAS